MHILFLSDNFPPEVNAPASRTFEHCREWVASGHQVTVITCAPNSQGRLIGHYRNRLWQSEIMEGIRVIRLWSYITDYRRNLTRILDYVSYMVSAVLASPFIKPPDMVVGTSPQFFTACAALAVSRMKQIPFVFELRDIWPESIKAVGAMKDSMAMRGLEKLELLLYHNASRIVSVTRSFKKILLDKGIDSNKIDVVTNGVDLSRFRPMPKNTEMIRRYGLEGKFVAGYIGNHGMAHGLDTILRAAELINTNSKGDRYRFLFVGDGQKKRDLISLARGMGLSNVIFIDCVPKDEVASYWSMLDASIIHLKDVDLFKSVIPSKLFESMGMGIPILHGVAGESAEIVTREKIGITFSPEDPEELCESLIRMNQDKELYENMKTRCWDTAVRNYDRTKLAADMLKVLENVYYCSRRLPSFAATPLNSAIPNYSARF